jgi:hypothetical protein
MARAIKLLKLHPMWQHEMFVAIRDVPAEKL